MNGIFLVILLSTTAGGSGEPVSFKFKTEAACRSAALKILAADGVESVGCKVQGGVKAVSKNK